MPDWRITWALFDLNGTLLDPGVIAEPLGGGIADRRLVREAFHEALLLTMADALSGGPHRPPTEYLRATLERALRSPDRDAASLDEAMERARAMDPFPDAPAALILLREAGLHLGVLTNSTFCVADTALAIAGLRDRFEVVIGSDEVQAFKPHPRDTSTRSRDWAPIRAMSSSWPRTAGMSRERCEPACEARGWRAADSGQGRSRPSRRCSARSSLT